MLPAIHQAWAETTGALWSSCTMIVRPLSSVVRLTPGGMAGKSPSNLLLVLFSILRQQQMRPEQFGSHRLGNQHLPIKLFEQIGPPNLQQCSDGGSVADYNHPRGRSWLSF